MIDNKCVCFCFIALSLNIPKLQGIVTYLLNDVKKTLKHLNPRPSTAFYTTPTSRRGVGTTPSCCLAPN